MSMRPHRIGSTGSSGLVTVRARHLLEAVSWRERPLRSTGFQIHRGQTGVDETARESVVSALFMFSRDIVGYRIGVEVSRKTVGDFIQLDEFG